MHQFILAKKYLVFWFKAKGKKGFGIHSPFLFSLLTTVIHQRKKNAGFAVIENERKKWKADRRTIQVEELGSGSQKTNLLNRKVSDIARISLKSVGQAQLLFRMAEHFQCKTILELGTSLGITTSYLASTLQKSRVITIEGSPETARLARQTFSHLNLDSIELHEGNFDHELPLVLANIQQLDFVFFDGNHRKGATLSYFEQCLPLATSQSLFVFDDIHRSDEMEEAWDTIIQHEKVTLSLDLFHLGIVFFRKELSKEHFSLRF